MENNITPLRMIRILKFLTIKQMSKFFELTEIYYEYIEEGCAQIDKTILKNGLKKLQIDFDDYQELEKFSNLLSKQNDKEKYALMLIKTIGIIYPHYKSSCEKLLEEKMIIGFPKMYAPMPLRNFSGYSYGLNELNLEYDIYAYVVAECYVINEIKSYRSNKEPQLFYEVVFTWEQNSEEEITPKFDIYSRCLNSTKVECVFNDLQQAKNYTRIKNNELIRRNAMVYPVSCYNAKKQELEKNVEQAYSLEEKHLKKQKIILKK